MAWTVENLTVATLDAFWDELVAAYATMNDNPENVVICPQLNPSPHPTRDELAGHIAAPRLDVRVLRENGALVLVLLMLDHNRVQAAWGPVDPDAIYRATIEAAAPYVEPLPYLIDTGAPGWVVREWFERHCAPADFFDTSVTHPGLDGALLEAWDDEMWRLVISRPTPADPWEWRYETIS